MDLPPFAVFLEEQREAVYRFLLGTVGAQAADDCFQETFLAALRAWGRLRVDSNLRGWVLAIATRKAMDHFRGERRRAAPAGREPERVALPPEVETGLRRGVQALPPLQRAAVVHRYVLAQPYAQVARALGCSEAAARASACAGRKKLRQRLGGRNR